MVLLRQKAFCKPYLQEPLYPVLKHNQLLSEMQHLFNHVQ